MPVSCGPCRFPVFEQWRQPPLGSTLKKSRATATTREENSDGRIPRSGQPSRTSRITGSPPNAQPGDCDRIGDCVAYISSSKPLARRIRVDGRVPGLSASVVCLLLDGMPGTVLLTVAVSRERCGLATSADAGSGVLPHGTSFPEF